MTTAWDFVVLECKGSQSNRASLDALVADGVAQKANIGFPSSVTAIRLVGGLFVPQWDSDEQARIVVRDPPADCEIQIPGAPRRRLAAAVLQGELASALTLAGLPNAASELASHSVTEGSYRLKAVADDLRGRERLQTSGGDFYGGETVEVSFPRDEGVDWMKDRPRRGRFRVLIRADVLDQLRDAADVTEWLESRIETEVDRWAPHGRAIKAAGDETPPFEHFEPAEVAIELASGLRIEAELE